MNVDRHTHSRVINIVTDDTSCYFSSLKRNIELDLILDVHLTPCRTARLGSCIGHSALASVSA